MATTKPVFKAPKSLAQCADLLYEIRAERLLQQKVVDELQAKETLLKNHLIDNLPKSEASGVAGKVARVSIGVDEVPRVEDWDKLYAYVKKNNAFELLQKRVANVAVEERWEHGKEVPGVGRFKVVKVSLNKL